MDCKLTRRDLTTYGGFKYAAGVWVKTSGEGPLCTDAWVHIYTHPLLARALNLIHADFTDPICWSVETGGKRLEDHGLKAGVSECRLIEQITLPEISTAALTRWAIQLSLSVYDEPTYSEWARDWLANTDRAESAESAASAAWSAESAESAARSATSKPLALAEILEQAIAEEIG